MLSKISDIINNFRYRYYIDISECKIYKIDKVDFYSSEINSIKLELVDLIYSSKIGVTVDSFTNTYIRLSYKEFKLLEYMFEITEGEK